MAEAKGRAIAGRLELAGRKPDEEAPPMALVVMSRDGKRLASAAIERDGGFSVPARARDAGARVLIGPAEGDPAESPERFLGYRFGDFERQLELGPLQFPEDRWRPILLWQCVRGSVRRCFPFPHWLDEVAVSGLALRTAGIADLAPIEPSSIIFPWRCGTVCQGLVEVYRRTCCCRPPYFPPKLPPLWPKQPPIPIPDPPDPWRPWPGPVPIPPPGPGPDPAPYHALDRVATSGALDVRKLNAERDELALSALSGAELGEYVRLRPYLWCTCGAGSKVAEGLVADDGSFSICWRSWPIFQVPGCRTEYAYRVSQSINGSNVTIYDGVAAGQWFDAGQTPVLTSYSPWAVTCAGDPEIPGTGDAIVLLHEIGATQSHALGTPAQDGPGSVQTPAWNSGLLNPAAADGPGVNRNLGGSLGLRYFFSHGMKDIGARFFRVQVAPADGLGNPAAAWTSVPVPAWQAWRWTGSGWLRSQHALGPDPNGLFVIPFEDVDLLDPLEEWDPDQYHAILDTTAHPDGRYLVTVEVFDAGGNQIKPNGASGPGTAKAFHFGLWRIPAGPPDDVPYSALTHLTWWDNRPAVVAIEAIRLAGNPSPATCQFLEGAATDSVSFDIRAYHPNPGVPLFLRGYSLGVTKGLNGPTTSYVNNAFAEVGEPPGGPSTSPTHPLSELLGTDPKCAFAVRLSAGVKTTNGSGTLIGLDRDVTAAFAAEQQP